MEYHGSAEDIARCTHAHPTLSEAVGEAARTRRFSDDLDECAARFGDTFTLRYRHFGTHVLISHPDDVRLVVSSGWSRPRDGGRSHRAIDIPLPAGTPILAIDDGVVVRA